jgi:hypothetical protein
MFEMKRSNYLVDRLMALYFTVSCAVYAWEFVHDLSAVGSGYQLH